MVTSIIEELVVLPNARKVLEKSLSSAVVDPNDP
jgi:hypothetical protein